MLQRLPTPVVAHQPAQPVGHEVTLGAHHRPGALPFDQGLRRSHRLDEGLAHQLAALDGAARQLELEPPGHLPDVRVDPAGDGKRPNAGDGCLHPKGIEDPGSNQVVPGLARLDKHHVAIVEPRPKGPRRSNGAGPPHDLVSVELTGGPEEVPAGEPGSMTEQVPQGRITRRDRIDQPEIRPIADDGFVEAELALLGQHPDRGRREGLGR